MITMSKVKQLPLNAGEYVVAVTTLRDCMYMITNTGALYKIEDRRL